MVVVASRIGRSRVIVGPVCADGVAVSGAASRKACAVIGPKRIYGSVGAGPNGNAAPEVRQIEGRRAIPYPVGGSDYPEKGGIDTRAAYGLTLTKQPPRRRGPARVLEDGPRRWKQAGLEVVRPQVAVHNIADRNIVVLDLAPKVRPGDVLVWKDDLGH